MVRKRKKVKKLSSVFSSKPALIITSIALILTTIFTIYISKNNQQTNIHGVLNAATYNGNSWLETFDGNSLDTNFWTVSNWSGLGDITNLHQGIFEPDRVSVNGGYLVLALTQQNGQVGTNPIGVISRGGEIQSNNIFGYGTYEWRMKASSTSPDPNDTTGNVVSGQISAGFNYINNSQTELDFEIQGQFPNQLGLTTWNNPNPLQNPIDNDSTYSAYNFPGMASGFHTYKYVWSPGEVKYYIDNSLAADHTFNVPSAPAFVLMNHWGTDSTNYGGLATVGTTRYMLVDWVRYTAPGSTPIPVPSTIASTPTITPIPFKKKHNH